MRVTVIALLLFSFLASGAGVGHAQRKPFWLNKKLPPLRVKDKQWVKGKRPPSRRGKVLWIQFGTLTDHFCRALDTHLVDWVKAYEKKGLLVIEVDDGRKATRLAIQAHARHAQRKYHVLWDPEGKLFEKFRVEGVPFAMLVSREGRIVWVGTPSPRDVAANRKRIEAELAKPLPEGMVEEAPAETLWMKSSDAFEQAKEDRKWILVFKLSPASPHSQKLHRGALTDKAVRKYLGENFHCVITDHPKFSVRKRESGLWTQTEFWDRKVFLWLLSPDRKKQVKVDITEGGKALDGPGLLKRLKETLAKSK